MHRFTRAGFAGLTTVFALFTLAPALPAAASISPQMSISDAWVTEGGIARFTVSVVGDHPNLSVNYSTRTGTAIEPDDYVGVALGTVTIASTASSATIDISTVQETQYEPDETFFVDLDPASTTATVTDRTGRGTIINDDPIPEFDITDGSVTEGDSGTADMVFYVFMTNPASQDAQVTVKTLPGTALGGGVDYKNLSTTLTFPAGSNATQQVSVKVVGDTIHEGDETFNVKLSSPLNATIGHGTAVGTIKDNDAVPQISVPSGPAAKILEGSSSPINKKVLVTVSLDHASTSDVTFKYSTSPGSATDGVDYQTVSNQVATIPALGTSTQVAVTVVGDSKVEPDENLFVIISDPVNATLGNSVREIVLQNDD